MLSISQLAQSSELARYIVGQVQASGSLRVMCLGDSLMAGADNTSGMRLPIYALLHLLGIPVTPVGDIFGSQSTDRYLYNTLGQGGNNYDGLKYQAEGGKKTTDYIAGTTNLTKLSTALTTNAPHIVIGCIGTNDPSPGSVELYKQLMQIMQTFNRDMPFIACGPPDSVDVTKSYYDSDASRADIKNTIRSAFRTGAKGTMVFSDTIASLGLWARYPSNDYTTDHLNANAMFYDGTHPKPEGSAMMAAGLFADAFGVSAVDMMEVLTSAGPFSPLDWAYGADVASTTAVMVASGPRKNTLNMLTVYNSDASVTATVTIGRRRISQDGSSTSTDTAFQAFKVPAGATVGWSFPHDSILAKRTAPTAHYNEGWYVTTTTTCNVRASGKQVVA